MSVLNILNELRSVKTNAKKEILKREKYNEVLNNVFDYAYNPSKTYNISNKTIPTPDCNAGYFDLAFAIDALDSLVNRTYTGNAGVKFLKNVMEQLSEDDCEVLRRIVLKDLECNTGASLAKSCWGSRYDYKPPQMLSSSQNDKSIDFVLKSSKGDLVAELKADGARCMTRILDDEILSYSRNYKTFNGLVRIQNALKSAGITDVVIDGEIVYKSSNNANREEGNGHVNRCISGIVPQEIANNFVYQVWDIVDVAVYDGNEKSVKTLRERRKQLEDFISVIADDECIDIIEQTPVTSLEEAKTVYKQYVDKGFEGIILKNNKSVWENKRSKHFVKFKEKFRIDVLVTGITQHKKEPTKIGGFYIQTMDGSIKCKVGSGLRNKQTVEDIADRFNSLDNTTLMELYNENPDKVINRVLEIECNGMTSCNGQKSFFLPIIKLWRNDKDEANTYQEVLEIMNLN